MVLAASQDAAQATLMNQHQPYCDHSHPPRQRCNRARAVEPAASESIIDVPTDGRPVSGPDGNGRSGTARTPVDDARSSMVRDTIATADTPTPTEYVTREWSKTASAVEQAYRSNPDTSPRPNDRPGPGPTIALLGAAVSLFLLLVIVVRRRTDGQTANS